MDMTNDFIREELRKFAPDARVELMMDATFDAAAFAVESNGRTARLRAANPTGLLHAAYTLLEHLGYRFEITGPVAPLRLKELPVLAETIRPAVQRRGIRQHINFPMDISSYPLDEAKEYLRNLTRLRFNHITFHSYPHQWIEAPGMLAGAFFYGWRFDLKDDPLLRRHVRNQQTFCIPEIEPYYDQPEEKSRRAVAWLQELMREAKRVGLTVQFSFEPVQTSFEAAEKMTECILATYPEIDILEIITRETGGWGNAPTVERLREIAAKYFNLSDVEPWLIDGQRDFDGYLADFGFNLQLVRRLHGRVRPKLSFGVYCAVPAYLKLSVQEMRKLPGDIEFAILAGHGSRRVARNLAEAGLTAADWARTLVYSWLEFDGIMYLQQNGTRGLQWLFENLPTPAGMAFNHWRTAENRVPARYSALATLRGRFPEAGFYAEYAGDLAIGEPAAFAEAMTELDEADALATEGLPNLGFCANGTWNMTDDIGALKWQNLNHLHLTLATYEKSLAALRRCAARTQAVAGRELLAFVDNRLRCTIVYLRAMEKLVAVLPLLQKPPAQLSTAERRQVVAACDEAAVSINHYSEIHAAAIADRGCEGTLVSFQNNLPRAVRNLRKVWGGVGESEPVCATGVAEPPLPIFAQ